VRTSGKRLGIIAIAIVFGAALLFIWLVQWQIEPSFNRAERIQAARSSILALEANLLDQDASVRGFSVWHDQRDLRSYLTDRNTFDGTMRKAGLEVAALPSSSAATFNRFYRGYHRWLSGVARPSIETKPATAELVAIRSRGARLMRGMRADLSAMLSMADDAATAELKRGEELAGAAAATAVLAVLAFMIIALLSEGRREILESEGMHFVEAVDDLVAVVNYQGYFLWTNLAWQRVLGHMPKDMKSRPFTDFVYPTDRAPTAYQMLRLSRNERVRGFRNRYRAKDGSYHWLVWNAVPDPSRRLIYVAARDETDHVRTETQLAQLSNNDHLTGLPNRRHFIQELNRSINIAQRHQLSFAVLYFDLDGLKEINDRKGHAAGDDALRGVVTSIAGRLRESDLFARVGGDEFAILTPPITLPRDIESMAEKIVEAARDKIKVGDETRSVGISMGVAGFPKDGTTANELIASADSAMYSAKRSGGNNYARYGEYLRESPPGA